MKRFALLALMLTACGGDDPDPPKSHGQLYCEHITQCPNVQSTKTVPECTKTADEWFDRGPASCGECMAGLTCAGLGMIVSDGVGSVCPSCPP